MSRGLSDLLDEEDIGGSYGIVAEPVMAAVVPTQPTSAKPSTTKKTKKKKKKRANAEEPHSQQYLLIVGLFCTVSGGLLLANWIYGSLNPHPGDGQGAVGASGAGTFGFGLAMLKRAFS